MPDGRGAEMETVREFPIELHGELPKKFAADKDVKDSNTWRLLVETPAEVILEVRRDDIAEALKIFYEWGMVPKEDVDKLAAELSA